MNPIEPDKHLQVALRHAPDADAKAPPELTAHILAAAHRSAAERPSPAFDPAVGWRTQLMAWWRLPQSHAAMATLLLAGVVGMLWRDERPGPVPDRDPTPVAQAPQKVAPPPPAAPRETAQAESRAPHKAEQGGRPEADAQNRQRQTRAAHNERAQVSAAPNSVVLTEPVAADQMRKRDADRLDKSSETAGAALPAAPVATATAPAPAALPVVATVATPAPAPARTQAPPVQVSGAANPTKPTPTDSSAAAAPSPAAPAARTLGVQAQHPSLSRLTPLPLALDMKALDGWTWQPGSALRQPDRAWMTALLQPAQGQWRPVGDAQPVKASLRLERSPQGELTQQIWLEPESLLWCVATRGCQRAPLAAQQRQALLEELVR